MSLHTTKYSLIKKKSNLITQDDVSKGDENIFNYIWT